MQTPTSPTQSVQCPKCGHRQADPEACHRCGLVFALAPSDDPPWEKPPRGREAAVSGFEELWAQARTQPDDAALHAQVGEYAREHGIQEWAIRRYRFLVADCEASDEEHPVISEQLHKLVRQVQIQAGIHVPTTRDASARRAGTRKFRRIVIAGLVILCVMALVVLVRTISWTQSMSIH